MDDSLVERVPQQNRPKQVQPQVPFDPNAPPPKPKRVRKPKALVAPIAPLVELGADTSLPNGGSEYARLQQLQRLKEQAKRYDRDLVILTKQFRILTLNLLSGISRSLFTNNEFEVDHHLPNSKLMIKKKSKLIERILED